MKVSYLTKCWIPERLAKEHEEHTRKPLLCVVRMQPDENDESKGFELLSFVLVDLGLARWRDLNEFGTAKSICRIRFLP